MSLSNDFIKKFFLAREMDSPYSSEDGSAVCIFDKRYRVHLIPLAENRIVLRSFVRFFPAKELEKENFIHKIFKLMQANLFACRVVLISDQEQQAIYAQSDLFDLSSLVDLEVGVEDFLNALIFFKEVTNDKI